MSSFLALFLTSSLSLTYGYTSLLITDQTVINCASINPQIGCTNATILCPLGEQCTVDCTKGCDGVMVDAETSTHLTLKNCNDVAFCKHMRIHCPRNGRGGSPNLCTFSGTTAITDSVIYTEEGFSDFTLANTLEMINTTVYCGKTTREFSCLSAKNGASCSETSVCDSFLIPTLEPTFSPTVAPQTFGAVTTKESAPQRINSDTNTNFLGANPSNTKHFVVFGTVICSLLCVCIMCFVIYWFRRGLRSTNSEQIHRQSLSQPLMVNATASDTTKSNEYYLPFDSVDDMHRKSKSVPYLGYVGPKFVECKGAKKAKVCANGYHGWDGASEGKMRGIGRDLQSEKTDECDMELELAYSADSADSDSDVLLMAQYDIRKLGPSSKSEYDDFMVYGGSNGTNQW